MALEHQHERDHHCNPRVGTYKVSGHATALDNNNPSSDLQTVSYEIAATCP
jgi:hypothetical protein